MEGDIQKEKNCYKCHHYISCALIKEIHKIFDFGGNNFRNMTYFNENDIMNIKNIIANKCFCYEKKGVKNE